MDVPTIRYARTSDGTHLAYQVVGDGPVDLALVSGGMFGNLETLSASAGGRRLPSLARLLLTS